MYKKVLWIMTLIFSLMLSTMALAQNHNSACKGRLANMVQMLNLDESQKAKIMPILDQLKSTMQTVKSQMATLKPQFEELVTATTLDQTKVDSLVDQKTKLIGQIMKAKIIAKNQIFSMLNPQQKERLQEMMKQAQERMSAKFEKCDQDQSNYNRDKQNNQYKQNSQY